MQEALMAKITKEKPIELLINGVRIICRDMVYHRMYYQSINHHFREDYILNNLLKYLLESEHVEQHMVSKIIGSKDKLQDELEDVKLISLDYLEARFFVQHYKIGKIGN